MKDRIFYTFDPYGDCPWEKALTESYEDGVRVFSFLYPMVLTWMEDGTYDYTLVDALTDRICELVPEGRLLPRVFLTTPFWWDERYPDELLKFSGPPPRDPVFSHENEPLWRYECKLFHSWHNASVASEQWRQDAGNALHDCVGHLTARYGRERIYAIQLAYGTCGEWGDFGTYKTGQFANGDFSAPMVRAYRAYLRRKYGAGEEFETVLPPSKLERMRTEHGMLRTPRAIERMQDYYEAAQEAKNESVAHFCRMVKSACPDMLCGCFGGYMMNAGSSAYSLHAFRNAAKGFLAVPELDFLSTPNSYFEKRSGGIFSQAPVRSVMRRKRFIAECDCRTAAAQDGYSNIPSGKSRDEFLRESAFNLLTSGNLWHYDFGRHWYGEDDVREVRRKLLNLDPALFAHPHQAEIAVVIDPESIRCTEGSSGYCREFSGLLSRELPRCGAFADHILMEDVTELPPYRLYIFRDAFLFRPELRDFLMRHSASALWLGPAGCVAEDRIDFRLAEKMTSFVLKEAEHAVAPNTVTLRNETHFLNEGLSLPLTPSGVEDLNAVWTPVLYAEPDEGASVAGLVESLDLPGVVSRKNGGRYDVWSASPLLPAELLRNLARAAGCVLRIPAGNAEIYGAGDVFAVRFMDGDPVSVRAAHPLEDLMTGNVHTPEDGRVILVRPRGHVMLLKERTK